MFSRIGKTIKDGEFQLNTLPGDAAEVSIVLPALRGICYLNVEVFDGDNRIYLWQTELTAEEDFRSLPKGEKLLVKDQGGSVLVEGRHFLYEIDKTQPSVKRIRYQHEILNAPCSLQHGAHRWIMIESWFRNGPPMRMGIIAILIWM